MILNLIPHGRTKRDVINFHQHLADTNGQKMRVLRIVGTILDEPRAAMFDLVRLRAGSKARVGLWHIPISPAGIPIPDSGGLRGWTEDELDRVIARILAEMGAPSHGYLLIEHVGKVRVDDAAPSNHYHLVVAHVGRNLKALDSAHLLLRLERLAAELSFDLGERAVPTRHHTVLAHLRDADRTDVAEAIEAVMLPGHVNSAMSATGRAVAARHGVDLAKARGKIATAWAASDTRAAFECALDEIGLKLVESTERVDRWVIATDEIVLGRLGRLLRLTPEMIASRINPADAKPLVESRKTDLPIALEADAQPNATLSPPGRCTLPAVEAPQRDATMTIITLPTEDGYVDLTSIAHIETVQPDEIAAPDRPCERESDEEIRDRERTRLQALLDDAKVRQASALAPPPPPQRLIEAERAFAQTKIRRTTASKSLEHAKRERDNAKAVVPPLVVRMLPWSRRQHQVALKAWDDAVQQAEAEHFRVVGDFDRAELAVELAEKAYDQAIAAGRPDREKRAKSIHEEIERLTERINCLDGWESYHHAPPLHAATLDRTRAPTPIRRTPSAGPA